MYKLFILLFNKQYVLIEYACTYVYTYMVFNLPKEKFIVLIWRNLFVELPR